MQKNKQILGPCQRTKKNVEHKADGDTNCSWYTRNYSQMLGKKTGGIGNQRKNWDHPDHSIDKIGWRVLGT